MDNIVIRLGQLELAVTALAIQTGMNKVIAEQLRDIRELALAGGADKTAFKLYDGLMASLQRGHGA